MKRRLAKKKQKAKCVDGSHFSNSREDCMNKGSACESISESSAECGDVETASKEGYRASKRNPDDVEKEADTEMSPICDMSEENEPRNAKEVDANGVDNLVVALKDEAQQHYDKYLRAVADLENYKRRAQKERSDLLRYAGENLARDLLEVVDNLELALNQNASASGSDILKGVEMIHKQFLSVLDRHSIKGEQAVGELFDPNKHQAVTAVPSEEYAPGTILEVFKKTYFFKDKLLRAGQVVVSRKPD